ncbi:MAG: DNA-protecting protein DprA [Merismopedia sp. SIO2A8]|nr:DNA-protecting protein DprA [Merismopedia sp. SIO2A8]
MKIEERAYWLAWSQVPKVGPTLLFRLQQHFGSLATAWQAEVVDLCSVEGIGLHTAEAIAQSRSNLNPHQLLDVHTRDNPHFWTPADLHYPHLLLETPDPPPVLYYRGQVEPGENQGIIPMVGIVGTREPSNYGQRWTRRISHTLADAGFSIVSGLALGIDAIAHQSCLEISGRTVAVIGTGVNIAYPWSNRRLAERIADEGLILSEYPIGTKPKAAHFPKRNRIIAGLCRAILVMEAPIRSGALITARVANDYGRDVYVLPGSLDEKRAEGCLRLIGQGAQVILGEQHLLEVLGAIPQLHEATSNTSIDPREGSGLGMEAIAYQMGEGQLTLDKQMPNQVPTQLPDKDFGLDRLSSNRVSPAPSSSQQGAASLAPMLQPPMPLEPQAQKVWEAVSPQTSTSLDAIVQSSQLPTGDVLALLAQLELLELVTQCPGMMYQRNPSPST